MNKTAALTVDADFQTQSEIEEFTIYCPEDFGAIGDGATDDSHAFRAIMTKIQTDELNRPRSAPDDHNKGI